MSSMDIYNYMKNIVRAQTPVTSVDYWELGCMESQLGRSSHSQSDHARLKAALDKNPSSIKVGHFNCTGVHSPTA